MKEVLIISYYFPPLGMGGVQRPAKWAKYLPEFGWKPVVITVKDIVYYAYDYSILREIEEVPVFRTESLDPLRVSKWFRVDKNNENSGSRSKKFGVLFRKFLNYWFIPDIRILWVPFVVIKAYKILKYDKHIKAVITTSPPNSVHVAGYILKKIFGVPWIADLRDDWLFEIETRSLTVFHKRVNRWILRKTLKFADGIVTVSSGIAERLNSFLLTNKVSIKIIPNGYEPDDFKYHLSKQDNTFKIVYTGSITKYTNPDMFIKGVALACSRNEKLKEKILLQFAGTVIDIDLAALIDEAGLGKNTIIYGYKDHNECIDLIVNADALLLLISEKLGRGMVTGKLFEYMAADKHIFALIPDCDAADILKQFGKADIISPVDVEGIADCIERYFRKYYEHRVNNKAADVFVEKFNRKNNVKDLSELLNSIQ